MQIIPANIQLVELNANFIDLMLILDACWSSLTQLLLQCFVLTRGWDCATVRGQYSGLWVCKPSQEST